MIRVGGKLGFMIRVGGKLGFMIRVGGKVYDLGWGQGL
jgi:hypothetical protein